MAKTLLTKSVALLSVLALIICCIPVVAAPLTISAASEYPNTHVNTGNMAADIVAVAETQAGYCEGSLSGNPAYASSSNYQKYGLWYDNNVDYIGVQSAAWCAAFVSWCANQAGVPSSIVYYHAYCPYGVNWFKNQGRFQYSASRGGSYTPKAGDIVYFAPAGSSVSSHIGIVRYVSGGRVYTVEGNTSGQAGEVNEGGGVFLKNYPVSYNRFLGYGIPAYQDNSGHTITFDSRGGSAVNSINVKDGNTVSQSAMPTPYRPGFNFAGWAYNPDGTSPYDESMVVTYGFTLYAIWEEAFWGPNNNLMPNSQQLQLDDFQGTGEKIWPYYNNDGSITMYNGVSSADWTWSWPSGYMEYMNSVDVANDAYIYIMKEGTAYFNAEIEYMDAKGNTHSVKLSQIAGRGDNDFEPGYSEIFVNFGQYVANQGHLVPNDGETFTGNVKFTKVRYYVVGGLDQYVKLYDMKFTPYFNPTPYYTNLYDQNATQSGHSGSYVYDGGTLSMNAETNNGYSVTFTPNAVVNPMEMTHILMDISSTAPFNVSMNVTSANGNATIDYRYEFFNHFGLTEIPDALPAGTWQTDSNLNGFFYYNGGIVNECTVNSVTITLEGAGNLTLAALQTSRSSYTNYVTNEEYSSGILEPTYTPVDDITSSVYTVADGVVSNVTAESTVAAFLQNIDQRDHIVVYDAAGNTVSDTALIATGMTVKVVVDGVEKSSYTVSVMGDINGDGEATTSDAREIVLYTVSAVSFNNAQILAADIDGSKIINTTDARDLLMAVVLGA